MNRIGKQKLNTDVHTSTADKALGSKPTFLFLMIKRLFDIVVSLSITILLLSWLLPILAILIRFDSRGSAFFLQKRIGANGKPFYCIKLRTMVKNALANVEQAGKNDPRITRLGKFLRYTYLDELPQFINVLSGDMSIVGPRPHMINDCLNFLQVIPDYNLRHMVKPGITGVAQIKGYRGKVESCFDITHRFKLDMFYVKKANLLFDIYVVYTTIAQILFSLNKYSQHKSTIRNKVWVPRPVHNPKPVIKKTIAPLYDELLPSGRQSA